jgi:hypothetical protein
VPPNATHGSPAALLKRQMAPRLWLLMFSGSRKEPRCACLSEAKASHRQRMLAEVSSSAPHFLHSGLSANLNKWRCLLRVLCPVRSLITTLDCILLKDRYILRIQMSTYEAFGRKQKQTPYVELKPACPSVCVTYAVSRIVMYLGALILYNSSCKLSYL